MSTPPGGARRRRPRRLLAKLALSGTLTLVLAEAALHVAPGLLPASFRGRYPLHGVGFLEPGLLERTPVEHVPLPLYVGDYVGPPPADLVELGVAPPAAAAPDRERHGTVEIRVDALGLPNPSIPERADVVFVGDSFAVSAGLTVPPGLVPRFAEATGLTTYVLGVAALGVPQERFLLTELGLPKRPRVVVWMFFGGNDLLDTLTTMFHRRQGRVTWGDVHAERRPPRLWLPALLRHLRGRRIDATHFEPVEGMRLATTDEDVWFHPLYLRQLTRTRAEWEADLAFAPALAEVEGAAADVRAQGGEFLFVYLPSKAQALLPLVEPDAERMHAMASYPAVDLALDPEPFQAAVLARVDALEEALRAACEARGIPFLSATPHLRAGARAGEDGYLVADTHWSTVGHGQLLGPLVDAVRGLLE